MTRQDIHKPSSINPADYLYVTVEYEKGMSWKELAHLQTDLQRHMERTGGKWSTHEHGGTCHVCGAWAQYTVVFHHPKTNTYIRTGFDCAEKVGIGDAALFRTFRKQVKDIRDRKAGKAKAELTLTEAGVGRAWMIYEMSTDELRELEAYDGKVYSWAYLTLRDIVGRLVKYGSVSEKQIDFLGKLVNQIDGAKQARIEKEAERAAEKANASPVPDDNERHIVAGVVLSTKYVDTMYGESFKMLLKTEEGYKLWGTVPSAIDNLDRGDKISFVARLERSKDDDYFGFYKRPSKARILEEAMAE